MSQLIEPVSPQAAQLEEKKKAQHPARFEPTTSRVLLRGPVLYRSATTEPQAPSKTAGSEYSRVMYPLAFIECSLLKGINTIVES